MKKTRIVTILLIAVLLVTFCLSGAIIAFADTAEPSAQSKGEINVWLIGGQSNAVGYGDNAPTEAQSDPRYYTGFDNTLYYGVHELPQYNPDEFVNLSIGNGQNEKRSGAELGIAKALDSTGQMNAVIKGAWGATALYPSLTASISTQVGTWTSPSYIERANMATTDANYETEGMYTPWGSDKAVDIPNVDTSATISDNRFGYEGETIAGHMYKLFIETVTEGVKMLVEMGYTPVLRGMWWMQGEAESGNATQSALYDELLTCLINDVRAEMNTIFGDDQGTDMPFVCGNIYRPETKNADGTYMYTQPAYLAKINDAQAIVAKNLKNVFVLENGDDDEGLADGEEVTVKDGYIDQPFFGQQDNWHFNVQTQQYFGEKFVEYVLSATEEYTVTVNGEGISFTGGGIYKSGTSVTVNFAADANYTIDSVMMSVGAGSASEVTLTDGAYTFELGDANVEFTVNTTYTGELITTEYGTVSAEYLSVKDYPFAVFKNGVFVKGHSSWKTAMSEIPATDSTDSYTILLRRDYETRGFDGAGASLAVNVGAALTIDLNGNSLTRGQSGYILDIYHNSSKVYDTDITVKNGNIITVSNASVIGLNYGTASAGYSEKTYNLTFDNVAFINQFDSLTRGMVTECWENGNGTANTGINVNLIYNNCTFDMGNAKGAVIMRLSGGVTNTKVCAEIYGGSIISASNDFIVASMDSEDSLTFGAYNGNYTTLTLPSGIAAPNTNYKNIENKPYSFSAADGVTSGDKVVYTLSENSLYVEGYGAIADEFENCVFAIFDKQGFVTGADTWGAAVSAAKDAVNSSSEKWAAVYLRANYTNDENVGDKTSDKIRLVNGTLVIDLGGNTLTRNNCTLFDMYASAADAKFTTMLEIKNGTLATKGGAIMAFDVPSEVNSVKKMYDITVENVTYKAESGASLTAPLAFTAWANKNTSVGMDVSIEYNNVIFDMTNSNGYHIFKAYDIADGRSGQVNINFVMNGGQVLNIGKSWIAHVDSGDGNKFGKYNGSYPTFTIEKGSVPYDGGGSSSGTIPTFGSVENNKLRLINCTAGDTYDTYSFAVSQYTPYGYIPFSESGTEAAKPFAVFAPGNSYVGVYSSWNSAVGNAVKASGSVIYLRADANQADNGNFSGNFGKITVDLNGHTLYRTGTTGYIVNTYFTNASAQKCEIIFENGIIINSSAYTGSNGMFCINYSASNAAVATLDLTFNNVTLINEKTTALMFTLWEDAYATETTKGTQTTATFNNCTIDSNGQTIFVLYRSNDTVRNKSDINVVINGGKIVSDKQINISDLYKKNDDDSVKFGKYEGNYTQIELPGSVAYPAYSIKFEGTSGEELTYVLSGENGSNSVYKLLPNYVTKYGNVPARYDAAAYPLALFDGNMSFIGGYSTFSAVYTKVSENLSGNYVLLLRRDMTKSDGKYIGNFKGSLTVDLGGNTLAIDVGGNYLFDLSASGTAGNTASLVLKNGTVNKASGRGIVCVNYNTDLKDKDTVYNFTFDGVTFRSTDNTYNKNVVFTTWENGYSGATSLLKVNSTFTDCTFDLAGSIDGAIMLPLYYSETAEATGRDRVVHNVIIKGGTIISDTAETFAENFVVLDDNTNGRADNITYAKNDSGKYVDLVITEGKTAPTVTVNGGTLVFSNVSSDENSTIYTLMPQAPLSLGFTPKSSITLGSELVYNVYVPVVDCLKSFAVDGELYENAEVVILEDGRSYYRIEVPMAASEAAKDIVLKATVTIDGKDYNGTWMMSIPKYAKKVIESGATEEEITLVKDVLAYIRAAYVYFDADGKDEAVAAIDEILGTYESTFEKVSGETNTESGLKGVIIVLESKPTIRFILPEGRSAENYTFCSGGRALDYTTGIYTEGETNYVYVEVELYAYQLIGEITYTDGTYSGSYHINSYYDFVTADEAHKNDADLITLVEKLYSYARSAEAYRASVVGN